MPNQSDTTVNLSAFYETARFNARLAWTDRSDFLQEFNYGDPRLDIYWEGRSQLDFTADFDVTEHVNVYLEAKNLTDSEGVRYAGVRSRPRPNATGRRGGCCGGWGRASGARW